MLMEISREEIRLCFETAEYVQISESHIVHNETEITFKFQCACEKTCEYAYDHCSLYKEKHEAVKHFFTEVNVINSNTP